MKRTLTLIALVSSSVCLHGMQETPAAAVTTTSTPVVVTPVAVVAAPAAVAAVTSDIPFTKEELVEAFTEGGRKYAAEHSWSAYGKWAASGIAHGAHAAATGIAHGARSAAAGIAHGARATTAGMLSPKAHTKQFATKWGAVAVVIGGTCYYFRKNIWNGIQLAWAKLPTWRKNKGTPVAQPTVVAAEENNAVAMVAEPATGSAATAAAPKPE